jgi:hypothetical protein
MATVLVDDTEWLQTRSKNNLDSGCQLAWSARAVRGQRLLKIVLRHFGHVVYIACAQPKIELLRRDRGVWELLYDLGHEKLQSL